MLCTWQDDGFNHRLRSIADPLAANAAPAMEILRTNDLFDCRCGARPSRGGLASRRRTAGQGTSARETAAAANAARARPRKRWPRPHALQRRTLRRGHARPSKRQASTRSSPRHHRSSRAGALSVHRRPRRFVAARDALRAVDPATSSPGIGSISSSASARPSFSRTTTGPPPTVRVHARPRAVLGEARAIRCSTGGRRRSIAMCGGCQPAWGRTPRPADCADGSGAPPRAVGGGGVLARRGRFCPWPRRPRLGCGDRAAGSGASSPRTAARRSDRISTVWSGNRSSPSASAAFPSPARPKPNRPRRDC